MEDLAREYITYARQQSSTGNYQKSLDYYLTAFEKHRRLRIEFEAEYRSVLSKYNSILAVTDKMENIFQNFSRAFDIFPDNAHILNDIGQYLFKYAFYKEAWSHFQRALRIDSGLVNAEKNLNSVKNFLVERWHFRMLNDKVRNLAYRDAIHQTMKLRERRESVLDIGTGTGLLAFYASECAPIIVTGCDGNEVMAKLAEDIMHENFVPDVVIINDMSTNLNSTEILGKKSLVVTELFDAALFGEHVLQVLCHAREHLMGELGQIIPNKAEFFVAGVNCDSLCKNYKLSKDAKALIEISDLHVHVKAYDETYDCDDVHLYKDLKYITEAESVLKIDFNDYYDLQDKLFRTEPYCLNLKAKQDGEVNLIIGWFNLYLTKEITITTDPRSETRANAWQQAVFFDNVPISLKEEESYEVNFSLISGKKMALEPNFEGVKRVSPEIIRFLNDVEYLKAIEKCIGMSCVYLEQMVSFADVNLIDLSPFPVFGFWLMKMGANSLICQARTDYDKRFMKKVFKQHKVSWSRVTVLMGDEWEIDVFRKEKYHAIYCNIFDMCGDIDIRQKELAEHLKAEHLELGGMFLPGNITLVAQIVSSHSLDINNRVYDENLLNYKMERLINKYQVSQNFNIDLMNLEYTPLSEEHTLGSCYGVMTPAVISLPIIKDGDANAIICWYIVEVIEDLVKVATNRKDSYIDGIAFLANPTVKVECNKMTNIIRCSDADGSFKLLIDGT